MQPRLRLARKVASLGVSWLRLGDDVLLMNQPGDLAPRNQAFQSILRRDRLRHLLDHHRIEVVLDVGANVGQFGESLRGLGFQGKIISFEPIADAASELQRRARQDPDWEVHQIGLGDFDGPATINVARDSVFSSLLPATDYMTQRFEGHGSVVRTETVQIRKLDTLMGDRLNGVDRLRLMLKLDTQGYDLHVVRGAQTLMNAVALLQAELSVVPIYEGMPPCWEAIQAFMHLGFKPAAMYPVTLSADGAHIIEFDFVFSRS